VPKSRPQTKSSRDAKSDRAKVIIGVGYISDHHPCIPDGDYEVRYLYYETRIMWGAPKVIAHFSIVTESHAGIEVYRYYNALRLIGPLQEGGNYEVGERSHLVREHRQLLGFPDRLDEISLADYKNKRILARIQQVKIDGEGEKLPKHARYSKIARLLQTIPDDS